MARCLIKSCEPGDVRKPKGLPMTLQQVKDLARPGNGPYLTILRRVSGFSFVSQNSHAPKIGMGATPR
jgi:hypothetical protein